MASLYTPVTGAVVGTTAYFKGKLVGRDVAITLPDVTPMTVTLPMMGEMEFPLWQLISNMQATVTKVGIDVLSQTMMSPELAPIEFRWAQQVQKMDGTSAVVGCKAFLNGLLSTLPGGSLEVGSASENDHTLNLIRYRLVIDGQEVVLVDRTAGKVVVNGKDYTKSTNALL